MEYYGKSLGSILAGLMGMMPEPAQYPKVSKVKSSRVRRDVLHYEPRFGRKTRKHGAGYRPGKLFKGHRI